MGEPRRPPRRRAVTQGPNEAKGEARAEQEEGATDGWPLRGPWSQSNCTSVAEDHEAGAWVAGLAGAKTVPKRVREALGAAGVDNSPRRPQLPPKCHDRTSRRKRPAV